MGCPGGVIKHLWIVIGDKPHGDGIGVAVNASKDVNRTKGECPLKAGDHPWIDENCAITFGDALELTRQKREFIKMGIAAKIIIEQPDASPELIARIQSAATLSDNFPKTFLKYF